VKKRREYSKQPCSFWFRAANRLSRSFERGKQRKGSSMGCKRTSKSPDMWKDIYTHGLPDWQYHR